LGSQKRREGRRLFRSGVGKSCGQKKEGKQLCNITSRGKEEGLATALGGSTEFVSKAKKKRNAQVVNRHEDKKEKLVKKKDKQEGESRRVILSKGSLNPGKGGHPA